MDQSYVVGRDEDEIAVKLERKGHDSDSRSVLYVILSELKDLLVIA